MQPFETAAAECSIPEPPATRPAVLIAHGHSDTWKTVRDGPRKNDYEVDAYEEGARSGLTITDIVSGMAEGAGFGVAVLTADDEQSDGQLRARQNVIHETGYMHATFGVPKVAILLEAGVEQFTNTAGVQYIGFPQGQPLMAMGDLLAHLRRESTGT